MSSISYWCTCTKESTHGDSGSKWHARTLTNFRKQQQIHEHILILTFSERKGSVKAQTDRVKSKLTQHKQDI